jgi:hypothetical protein
VTIEELSSAIVTTQSRGQGTLSNTKKTKGATNPSIAQGSGYHKGAFETRGREKEKENNELIELQKRIHGFIKAKTQQNPYWA